MKYEKPILEIVIFENMDVITLSGEDEGYGNVGDGSNIFG